MQNCAQKYVYRYVILFLAIIIIYYLYLWNKVTPQFSGIVVYLYGIY